MEYLALVRLRALIAQRAEVAQAEAQEVTLKKAIESLLRVLMKPLIGARTRTGPSSREAKSWLRLECLFLIPLNHKAHGRRKPSRPPILL